MRSFMEAAAAERDGHGPKMHPVPSAWLLLPAQWDALPGCEEGKSPAGRLEHSHGGLVRRDLSSSQAEW